MKLQNPNFDKKAQFKKIETTIYLILMLPLAAFAWVFLEGQRDNKLRSVFFEDPDLLFHGVMAVGVIYVLMRTVGTWKRDVLRALESTPELDLKIQRLVKPIIYRNLLWALGAGIGAYGLYEKGDMVYALVFMIFMVLITANRPTGRYFSKFLRLKDEEKKWMES
jgi:hypothetical protein